MNHKKKYIFIIVSIIAILLNTKSFTLTNEQIKKCYYKSFELEKKQQYAKAIKALMPIYKIYPNTYTVNLRLGWLYYLRKNYKNSEYHYQKASNAIPTAIEPLLGLTLPLLAEEKWKEAEQICYRILKKDFYNYYGNLRLCFALRMQKKYQLAETIARKMLTLYPTDLLFLRELGLNLYLSNKKKEAYRIFQNILILSPKDPIASRYIRNS